MSARLRQPLRSVRRQAGIGIVTAIFLLVVLAALGAAIMSLSNSQQSGAALDMQGSFAYQAARAGAEWGVYKALRTNVNNCVAATTFAMPASTASDKTNLAQFTVTVNCSFIAGPTVALNRRIIRATACNQPGPAGCPNASANLDYVQRVVEVKL